MISLAWFVKSWFYFYDIIVVLLSIMMISVTSDIIGLVWWYHSLYHMHNHIMTRIWCHGIETMILVTYDIIMIGLGYHCQHHLPNYVWYHEIETKWFRPALQIPFSQTQPWIGNCTTRGCYFFVLKRSKNFR